MEIRDKIKAARASKKITQKELAEKIGVTQATITKIETGETKNPSVDIALKIADTLGEDIYKLFSDESSNRILSNVSDKEIDRLKILVFHSLDKCESNQIFLKQFDFELNDPENSKKFEEYVFILQEFKKDIFEKLIEVGFCSQEDIKEYKDFVYKQANEKLKGKTWFE